MNETATAAVSDGKKRVRATRKQSNYMVFKDIGDSDSEGRQRYLSVATGATVKACIKSIVDGKIAGALLVVCVRRRLTAEVQETLKLT